MKTKNKIKCFSIYLLGLLMIACGEEEFIGQPGSDGVAPAPISNISSESIAGGAIISYTTPKDNDFSHVLAVYNANENTQRESVSTRYVQKLTVDGFPDIQPKTVALYAVDKSGNKSEKVEVEIIPGKPPYVKIFESLKVRDDFSGVFMDWENEDDAQGIGITVLSYDEFGDFVPYDIVYDDISNETSANVRGLDTLDIDLGFFVKDRWGNISDTLTGTFKPLYETKLDRKLWKGLELDTDIPANNNARDISKTYDGNTKQARWEGYLSTKNADLSYMPHHVTYDLGETNLLSRFILWPIWYDAFKLGGIRIFELYGTNDKNLIDRETDGAYDWNGDEDPNITGEWKEYGMDGWDPIGTFEVIKPSGLPGTAYTQDCNTCDRDVIEANGSEFNIPPGTPAYRYIRLRTVELWEKALKYSNWSEIEFFGSPVN